MKNLLENHKAFFSIAFMSLMLGFTSCSSSNDDLADDIHVAMEMPGSYFGKVEVTQPRKENNNTEENKPEVQEPGDIALTVLKDKKMKFKNFPINDIIKGLYEEELANEIIEKIGDYNLDLTFIPKNEKDGVLYFQLATEEFVIPVVNIEPTNLVVEIETDNKTGLYTKKETTGKIEFEIKIKTKTPNISEHAYQAIMKFNFEKVTK